jgi:hypothetical protein
LVLVTCSENANKKIKCGSLSARNATEQLLVVLRQIRSISSLDSSKYHITVSYGAGYFPKIPWVAITPVGRKVSNSVSVCICFAKYGEGIVFGTMLPRYKKNTKIERPKRIPKDKIQLIATAGRSYTNKFINPTELKKGKSQKIF